MDSPPICTGRATVLDDVPADALAVDRGDLRPDRPRGRRSASLDEAIRLTNESPYGLLAASSRPTSTTASASPTRCTAGLVNINETTNYWENHLPFGGRAGTDSGTGRVGGRHPFEVLTELQTVVIGTR